MEEIHFFLDKQFNSTSEEIASLEEKFEDEEFAFSEPEEFRDVELKLYVLEGQLKAILEVKKIIKNKPFVGLFRDELLKEISLMRDKNVEKLEEIQEIIEEYAGVLLREESEQLNDYEELEQKRKLQTGFLNQLSTIADFLKDNIKEWS